MWEVERIYQDQDSIFEGISRAIRTAKTSVDFETFIFELDSLGNPLLGDLVRAASRGVRVRLLVDGAGSPHFDEATIHSLKKLRVRVRIYRPLRNFFRRMFWFMISFQWSSFRSEFSFMNKRNHRKLCLIDGKSAWLGSANVSIRHAQWRETFVELEGENVGKIRESFDRVWSISRESRSVFSKNTEIHDCDDLHLSFGTPSKRKNDRFRRAWIDRAQKKIRLVSPYFIPPFQFLRALIRARRRGVEVEIMVPRVSDYPVVNWISRTYYSVLISVGVRIYEYTRSMLHSKVLIVDDRVILGSSNFNFRSFLHDMEIDAILSKPETLHALSSQWDLDLVQCVEVSRFPEAQRSLFERYLLRLLLVFRRFL